jgi:hypothetical protein
MGTTHSPISKATRPTIQGRWRVSRLKASTATIKKTAAATDR